MTNDTEGTLEFLTFNMTMATGPSLEWSPEEQARQSGPHKYWINATELCSKLNSKKDFRAYMSNRGTMEYLEALQDTSFEQGGMPDGPSDQSHIYRMGNQGFGHHAWICPRLLLHLVHWLSPTVSVRLNHLMFQFLSGQMCSSEGRAAMEQV